MTLRGDIFCNLIQMYILKRDYYFVFGRPSHPTPSGTGTSQNNNLFSIIIIVLYVLYLIAGWTQLRPAERDYAGRADLVIVTF